MAKTRSKGVRIRVSTRGGSFWRAGMRFTQEPVEIRVPSGVVAVLRAEPRLHVQEVEGVAEALPPVGEE